MTEVVLHGNLGVKFGKNFKCKISSVREVFSFIDANRPGFSECLKKLSQQGMHYALILDGKKLSDMKEINNKKNIKKIDIVPAVLGKGPIAVGIGATIATIALSSALAAGTISLTTFIVASVVIAVVSMALQMMLAPKPPEPPSIEATTRALQQSFYFATKANIAEQGNNIPVGYGRLLVSSYVIEASEKNFPQNIRANEIFGNGIKDKYLGGKLDRVKSGIVFPGEKPDNVEVWGQDSSFEFEHDSFYDPLRCIGARGLQIEGMGTHLVEFHDDPNHRLKVYRWNQSSPLNYTTYSQQSLGSGFWSQVFYMNGNGGIQQRTLTPNGMNSGYYQYNTISFKSNTPEVQNDNPTCQPPYISPQWGSSVSFDVKNSIRIVVTDYDQKPGYNSATDPGPPGIIRAEFSINFTSKRTVMYGKTGEIPQDLDRKKVFFWQTSNAGKPLGYPNYGPGPLTRFGATNGQAPSISNGRLI